MKKKVFIFALVITLIPLLVAMQKVDADDEENEVSSAEIMALIDHYENEGEFEKSQVAYALKLHLKAVDHFEKQEASEKVVKHMKGFASLLDHQNDNGQLSEEVYSVLTDKTEALIQKWGTLTIVQDGQAHAEILLSTDASDMEMLGATELQETIEKISGATLSILEEDLDNVSSDDLVQVILATPDSYPGLSERFADDLDFLEDSDGFAVRQSDNTIYIFGTNPRGLLNGVYDFLEENTGILWTRSKELGTVYESQSTIKAKKVDYKEKSPFEVRGWHTTGRGDEGISHVDFKTLKMLARNKLNAKYASFNDLPYWEEHESMGLKAIHLGHNLKQWLPNEEYFESHPEYYTWRNGKYIPVGEGQLNFYHPDLPGIFAEKVIDFHEENGTEYIGIGIEDNKNFTESEESKQPFTTPDGVVVQPDDPAYQSTVFFTFLNKVATEVKESHPDVKILSFAYFFLEVPPKVELEDNIAIMLAPATEDERISFNTDDENSENYKYKLMIEEWAEKTKNIIYRGYYGCCDADSYERPIAEKVQEDAQYFRDLGIMGFLPEGVVDANRTAWGVNALQFWLFHKIYWNPEADLDELKEEFITKVYGDAAEPMKRYYDLIEQGWNYDQQPVTLYTNANQLYTQYVIKARINDDVQDALDEAWDLASDAVKERIEPIRTTYMEMIELYGDPSFMSANAVKTDATEEEILESLDFSTDPWGEAEPTTEFFYHKTEDRAPAETKVRLLWDNENLYVGYENFDDDMSEMVTSGVQNNYWIGATNDSAETHIANGDGGTTYAYFTNSVTDRFVYRTGPSPIPDAEFNASAKLLSDRWNVIQVIPFADVDIDPQMTNEFKVLFMRNYHGSDNYSWGGSQVWSPADLNHINLIEK